MSVAAIIWGLDAADFKTIGLVVFFGFFMVVVLRLVFARRGRYRHAAQLPLEDDDPPHGNETGSGRAEP